MGLSLTEELSRRKFLLWASILVNLGFLGFFKYYNFFVESFADAFTLFELFEGKLEEYNGNLQRAAVELAKLWRSDKILRKLEAMLIIMNETDLLLVSGTGEVIEPDDGILAIGSGGNYALSAGRALKQYSGEHLSAYEIAKAALEIAGDICVYTNNNIIVEEL